MRDPIKEIKKLLRIPVREEFNGILSLYGESDRNRYCLIDFLGMHSSLDINPESGASEEKMHFDPNWILYLSSSDELIVFTQDGSSIEWKGKLKKSPRSLVDFNSSCSFLPSEVKLEVWIRWFKQNRVAKVVRYSIKK